MQNKITLAHHNSLVRALTAAVVFVMTLAAGAHAQSSLVWTGAANANWDAASQNWTVGAGGPAAAFANGDSVLFDNNSTTTNITIVGTVLPSSVTVDAARSILINLPAGGGISGTASFEKRGAGKLSHSGVFVNFTGTTTIYEGIFSSTMNVSSAPSIGLGPVVFAGGTYSAINAKAGGTPTLANTFITPAGVHGVIDMSNATAFRLTGTFLGSGTLSVNLKPGTAGVGDFRGTSDFREFDGELRIVGSGTIKHQWSTGTNWARTSLVLDGAGFLPDAGSARTLEFGALGSVNGGMSIVGNGASSGQTGITTFVIGRKNLDTTYLGKIDGPYAALTKVGTGMLTLAGVNTYTGTTTVSEGALRVTGQLANTASVIVASSAAFGGSGIIANNVSYENLSTLLVDVGQDGTLSGPHVTGRISFGSVGATEIIVKPVVPEGVRLTNGVYTVLEAEGGFANTPAFTWAYPADTAVSGTFSVINSNKLVLTIAGGAIAKPVITSALKVDGLANQSFNYAFEATNDPASPTILSVGGLAGTGLSFDSATGVISGTPTADGRYSVTLSASNSSGATTATLEIIIYATMPPVPVITSATTATAVVGSAFSYNITASHDPTGYDASNLSAGLVINKTTGEISGAPESAAVGTVTIFAKNISGSGSALLELTVSLPPPVITSPKTTTTIQGTPFSYQITASNDPRSFSTTGFPADFVINTTTGLVTGTFAASGTTSAILYATNPAGTGSETLAITVLIPPPVIQSSTVASGMVGADFSYQIAASNTPTTYAALNLPAGLSVNTATGLISGKPEASGTYSVTLVAMNGTGPGNAYLTLTISGESALTTLAGSSTAPAALVDGPAADARFSAPSAAAVDKDGNLYIADTDNNAIRKIATDGTVSTFVTGFNAPSAIVIDAAGAVLYVADTGSGTIKKIDIATKAPSPLALTGTPALSVPHGLAIDAAGNLYIADAGNNTIRKAVLATGAMTTLAGTAGASGSADGTGSAATFDRPMGLALDADATHLYIADTNNSAIRRITLATGLVETIDTIGVALNTPEGLAIDTAGILYIANTGDDTICTLDTVNGAASTIAGIAGTSGGQDGTGGQSTLNAPRGIVIDSTGDIYVLDTANNTIRVLQTGPYIMSSPVSQTVVAGASVTLRVAASGAPTPTYQWHKDGVAIAGATEATLVINPVQRTDAANYSAIVTNPMGSVQSAAATLKVDGQPSPASNDGFGSGGGGGAPGWLYFLALSILAGAYALRQRRGRRRRSADCQVCLLLAGLLILSAATPHLHAQTSDATNGAITGKVSSEKTGLALVAAEVALTADTGDKTARANTENDGTFRFGNLEPGDYTIKISYADLDTQTRRVSLKSGATVSLDILMTSGLVVLEAFTVTAEREGQSAAIQRQRQSDVMKNVVAADAFGNLIDTNPGELLKNLPGVFVDYTGEDVASYSIRGVSSDEGSFTVDGNAFANSGGDNNRGVNLKQVNIAALESVEIYKSQPPSSPANANGGVINMITKNAFDQKGRRIDLQASLGLNTSALNFAPVPTGNRTPDRVWSPGFNLYYSEAFFKNRLGISFSANAYQTYRFNDDYRIGAYEYDKPAASFPTADMTGYSSNISLTEASGRVQRRGLSLNLDYKVSRNTAVYIKTSYNDSRSLSDSGASMTFYASDGTVYKTTSDFNRLEVDNMKFTMGVDGPAKNKNQAWSINPGVKHTFGNIRLDYDGYVSRSFLQVKPNSETVRYTSPVGHYILDNIQSKHGPTIQQLGITSTNDYLDLNNYTGLYLESRDRLYTDEKSGGKANIRVPVSLFGYTTLLQAGVTYNTWTRDRRDYRYRYTLNTTSAAVPKYGEFYDPVRGDAWEFKSMPVANWISKWKVSDYFAENPNMFTFDSSRNEDSLYSNVSLEENITAGYAMASTRISDFNIMAGVRYEYTDATSSGYATDKTLPRTDPNYHQWVVGQKSYDQFFPSVQLRYEPLPNLIFRAAFTTSIGRPRLEYLIPADSISTNDSSHIVTVIKKNSGLDPQYAKNYDFGVEYYLPHSGILSANIFRKEISDYIMESERDLASYPELMAQQYYRDLIEKYPGYDILVTTALNAGSATMQGFELAYRQRLAFLPSFLKNIELNGSFSYAKPDGDIAIANMKQKVANAQIKYRAHGWIIQLGYYWCGEYLAVDPSFATNPDGSTSFGTDGIYERASDRFDLSVSYQFSRVWTVALDWRNVLNEPIRQREIFNRISRYSEAGTVVNLTLKCKL